MTRQQITELSFEGHSRSGKLTVLTSPEKLNRYYRCSKKCERQKWLLYCHSSSQNKYNDKNFKFGRTDRMIEVCDDCLKRIL